MRIVYIDMDGVLCDFRSARDLARRRDPGQPYPQSVAGFYRGLAPLEGAIGAFRNLLTRPDIDLHILTAPSLPNPLCYTEKRLWVEDHLGFEVVRRLIIAPDKSLLRGDILVDDHLTGSGQDNFAGELIHFGGSAYPDWPAVLSRLEEVRS